jgi:putative aldouronate transport system permease protein
MVRKGKEMAKFQKKFNMSDTVFNIMLYGFIWLSFLAILYPLIYILSASFSAPRAVISGRVWLYPVELSLTGYEAVFKNSRILIGFANSLYYMFFGTAVNIVLTVLAAFPLSRKEFYGRNLIMGFFVFTMLFSGGLVPLYLLVKNLGIYNTRWAMILPTAMAVWNVIISRTYFKTTIPDEMYEVGQIDGCSDFRFLMRIVLPLSGPIIAVNVLYYGVANWNSYFNALIYLRTPKLQPLQIVLREILVLNTISPEVLKDYDVMLRKQGLVDVIKYSVIVVASVPVLCLYPFVQKYFVKGVMIGAIKG